MKLLKNFYSFNEDNIVKGNIYKDFFEYVI